MGMRMRMQRPSSVRAKEVLELFKLIYTDGSVGCLIECLIPLLAFLGVPVIISGGLNLLSCLFFFFFLEAYLACSTLYSLPS